LAFFLILNIVTVFRSLGASPPPLSGSEVFNRASGNVFKLISRLKDAVSERGHGTGFVIHPHGFLVTNFHVVASVLEQPEKYVLMLVDKQNQIPAEVVAVDAVNDLALVRVQQRFERFLPIAPYENFATGETVYSLGFPKSEELTIIQGTFNGERTMGFAPVFAASMPLNPGMSGGPTLNASGFVIGVNRAMMNQAQNISYLSPWASLVAIAAKIQAGVSRSFDWRQEAVKQILAQEKRANSNFLSRSSLIKPQKVGGLSFMLSLSNLLCGQDDLEKKGGMALMCQGVSLALLGSDIEALEFEMLVTRGDSPFSANSFGRVDRRYGDAKSRYKKLLEATEAKGPRKKLPERCGARNVRNQHGINLIARYCSLAIPKFPGLFSTFVKIEFNSGGEKTKVGQYYQGLGLETTTSILEKFLDSIETGGNK
jgi:hypothetical protein